MLGSALGAAAFDAYIRALLRRAARGLEERSRRRFRWPMYPVVPPPSAEIARWREDQSATKRSVTEQKHSHFINGIGNRLGNGYRNGFDEKRTK